MRFALIVLLMSFFSLSHAHAAGWKSYHNNRLGFSLRYPPNWHVTGSSVPGMEQVEFGYQGRSNYSLTVQVLPFRPARSLGQTLRRFISFEQRTGQVLATRGKWVPVRLAHYPAIATIAKPSTEGGVSLAQAIILTQSRSHVYEITEVSYGKPAPFTFSQFPAIYGAILESLRFRS